MIKTTAYRYESMRNPRSIPRLSRDRSRRSQMTRGERDARKLLILRSITGIVMANATELDSKRLTEEDGRL